jgi:hypothetical protein
LSKNAFAFQKDLRRELGGEFESTAEIYPIKPKKAFLPVLPDIKKPSQN